MPRDLTESILSSASDWRTCIIGGSGSLLGGLDCWNPETIADLRRRFEGNLLEGEGGFLDKLRVQLDRAPPATIQLAAELIWLLYLFPSSILRPRKISNIATVWNWSGSPLDTTQSHLSDEAMKGVGSCGPGYNNHFWREFLFGVIMCDELARQSAENRKSLLASGDAFARWVDLLDSSKNRQFRHTLLCLLFPSDFDTISSRGDKAKILQAFKEPVDQGMDDPRLAIDHALRSLRTRLMDQGKPEGFSFYDAEIATVWSAGGDSDAVAFEVGQGLPPDELTDIANGVRYWLVGANWSGTDKTPEFVDAGVWMNGYEDKYLDTVRTVREGDKVAIKAAFRQKKGLPFDNGGKDTGIMRLKARGRVTSNPSDGRRLIVEWDEDFAQKDIYSYVWQPTISELSSRKWPEVIAWVFYDQAQPLPGTAAMKVPRGGTQSILFAAEEPPVPDYQHIPINRIYYGPPGTGKTWKILGGEGLERMADYLRTDRIDGKSGLEMVTFHQSFTYEDFVQGLRPVPRGNAVAYEPREGLFKRLCRRASENPEHRFAIFIDEINRGNLSSIFGELITLVEADKRLTFTESGEPDYSRPGTSVTLPLNDESFGIPCNVDIFATMNTADRSLVRIDTALRRRFEFVECMPEPELLRGKVIAGVDLERMLAAMNDRIEAILDRDHLIGHAYFMDLDPELGIDALANAFAKKILPLLEEYFFEDWGQIEKVLNERAKSSDALRFVRRIQEGGEEEEYRRRRYRRNPQALSEPEAYRGIYA